MSEPKLKPCPFCGGEARLIFDGALHWGYCGGCDVDGPTSPNERVATERWNRRIEPVRGKSYLRDALNEDEMARNLEDK